MSETFGFTRKSLRCAGGTVDVFSLPALLSHAGHDLSRLPYCIRVLLECVLRRQDHTACDEGHVAGLAAWKPGTDGRREYPFLPARVLLQDFTGVPCLVDLAALRTELLRSGGDPLRVEPGIPVDLVIDHSVQVDEYAHPGAYAANLDHEYRRNRERYIFLRWGQSAFRKLTVLPPGLGICHQVNMEHLGRVVVRETRDGRDIAYPDTLVGTDSHTPMINSMGILGWGVGGIEAEAAMLGQPVPLITPAVTGVRVTGTLRPGATPTDIALTVTQRLRALGVVGHFVEFFGPGLDGMTVADRAPIANMAPEYGATTGFFPVDGETLAYLRMTGRGDDHVELVERYCKEQGLWRSSGDVPLYDQVVEIDLSDIEPSIAGPRRPQDRLPLRELGADFTRRVTLPADKGGYGVAAAQAGAVRAVAGRGELRHGSLLIAAITSCTNTSNPTLMLSAGLVARKAAARGLRLPPWVKTSFAPGSRVVTEYLRRTGLLADLERIGFHVVAYGCTTCIGNSGPLAPDLAGPAADSGLVLAAALSGNRNFEGRIHPHTQANYLCSPPLVVALALRGAVTANLEQEPVGTGSDGRAVFLRDLWPTADEIRALLATADDPELYRQAYRDVFRAADAWNSLPSGGGAAFEWDPSSTYIRLPPWTDGVAAEPPPVTGIRQAAVLGLYGDFVTTDHISPAGDIPADSAAGLYLRGLGVDPADFNSYGARRGNHEVMLRGTFANTRLRNRLADRSGGWTRHHPTGRAMFMHEAAELYARSGTPLVVVAGKMYGAGSSRDWAAKGPALLGVRAVLAESYERIHRSNLVGMGVLPVEFADGARVQELGLDGSETLDITGLEEELYPGKWLAVTARRRDETIQFQARCRLDSPLEIEYWRHGGILPYVLRSLRG